MKQKTFLTLIFTATVIAISIGLIARNLYPEKASEKEVLKRKLNTSNEIIEYLEEQIDTLEIIVKTSHNSAVKFEILVGVKEPNGIVEYKEKLLIANKNIHKLNRAKLK